MERPVFEYEYPQPEWPEFVARVEWVKKEDLLKEDPDILDFTSGFTSIDPYDTPMLLPRGTYTSPTTITRMTPHEFETTTGPDLACP